MESQAKVAGRFGAGQTHVFAPEILDSFSSEQLAALELVLLR